MGDYYKYKKILVILMIVSCGFSIIRNIFKTNVQASEAVEVTPVWNDGDYTYQSDNQYLTLRQNQIDTQNGFINFCYKAYYNGTETQKTNILNSLRDIYRFLASSDGSNVYYGGLNRRFIHFENILTNVNGVSTYNYSYTTVTGRYMTNIVYADATLNTGYKILSVPFYQFPLSLNGGCIHKLLRSDTAALEDATSGNYQLPVAEVGVYSELWVQLFKDVGLIDTIDYNNILADIQETNELNYTQNYYTKQAVQNTYSYITNDNVDTISSSGITQPQVNEPDISDAFDSLSDLLTNDNATTKFFTFTLPNGSSHVFALSPDFLRTSLTRVGGGELVTIIETLWYIGLYGLMIFTGLKIIGALLSGDLDAVTGVLSPVNSVVNSSLEVTGAFRTAGGDESAFRIRKG